MSTQTPAVVNAAEEYFSNINSIANRIYTDFEETKNSYECVWNTLSFEEQTQILNECIIKPEITIQYNLNSSAVCDNISSNIFAQKRVVDENSSFRDEHSAPFSFKTLSQIDLRLFGNAPVRKIVVTPKLVSPKLEPPKNQPISTTSTSTSTSTTSTISPTSTTATASTTRYGALLGKLFGRPSGIEEREALVSPQSTDTTCTTSTTMSTTGDATTSGDVFIFKETNSLPKTGLDFLDNW